VAGRLPERLLFPRNLIQTHFGSRIFANINRRLKRKKKEVIKTSYENFSK